MPIKYPIQYELHPPQIGVGMRWLTVTLRNIGDEELSGLDVRLNSMDDYNIRVFGTGNYIPELYSNEDRAVAFQVSANVTTSLYVTLDGWSAGAPFHWESPAILVMVGQEDAELVSLFTMTEPYPPSGEPLEVEATVRSMAHSTGMQLELWVEAPSGSFDQLEEVELGELEAGKLVRHTAEFVPHEVGLYKIYAYLQSEVRRIGRQIEQVYVREA